MTTLDIEKLEQFAFTNRERFATAQPFPHIVIDNFLAPDAAAAVIADFDAIRGDWKFYHHFNEKKVGFNDLSLMPSASQTLIADLHSRAFLQVLGTLTGIQPLIADPDLDGGGLQQMHSGGFLNVHTDFLAHTRKPAWSRQLNLLVFLNPGWPEEYRGWLEFWDRDVTRCVQRIAPVFNRCVIFHTSNISFHGVPAGVTCPAEHSRKSLALYYFRDEGRFCRLTPTYYVPLPGDSLVKRLLIHLDRRLLYGYSLLKRYTPVGDRLVSKLLKHL